MTPHSINPVAFQMAIALGNALRVLDESRNALAAAVVTDLQLALLKYVYEALEGNEPFYL